MNQQIQNQINLAIRYFDQQEAIRILSELQNSGQLDMADHEIMKLFYVRINSLPIEKLSEVLKSSVLASYEIEGFLLSSRFKEYLTQYNFIPDELALCQKTIDILETNEEVLGEYYLDVAGRDLAPTIKNWIYDYTTSLGSRKKDALSMMQYINTSTNVRSLSPQHRVILKDILELYNYCNELMALWDKLPSEVDSKEVQDIGKIFDWNKMILGLDNLEVESPVVSQSFTQSSSQDTKQAPAQSQQSQSDAKPQPTVSKPQPATPRAPANLPEFDAARPTPSPTLNENKYVPPAEPAPQQPKPRMNVPNQYTANPGKIHDIINQKPKQKVGVVMDPTNIKLEEEKRRLSQDRNDQADIIQLKLAELRKRNKTEQDQNSQTKQ